MGGWGGLGSLKIGLVWFSGCLNEVPFVGDVVADVFRCVFFVPDLQFPRVVEIAGVLKTGVDTDIAVGIAQIPVFQAVLSFPIVQPLHDFGNAFRRQNHARAENVVQDIVYGILVFALGVAADFVGDAFGGFDAVEKVYAARVGECQVVVNRFVQVETVGQNMLGGHMGERAAEIELGDFASFKIILRIFVVNLVDFAD